MSDYENRSYLSVVEVANHTGLSVDAIHRMIRFGELPATKSASGQYRFDLQGRSLVSQERALRQLPRATLKPAHAPVDLNHTTQRIILGDSRSMDQVASDSLHLAITSPPYFNAKMYSLAGDEISGSDLGNVHDLDRWLEQISLVWREVYRVLQPGRKFFLNIMNLPIRQGSSFRALNLVGRNVDLCEEIGFIFKRDIIWHKTNGVRAHFGTYPDPGGILINNMHESILEFEKPARKSARKYAHVTPEQREASKLDKDFWLSLKNSDVWLMKPERSGGGREHAAPFPVELTGAPHPSLQLCRRDRDRPVPRLRHNPGRCGAIRA